MYPRKYKLTELDCDSVIPLSQERNPTVYGLPHNVRVVPVIPVYIEVYVLFMFLYVGSYLFI